ncbi:HlyD family efflux transporter periplasmic adaptor subunit [Actinoplanes sp. NBRC 101535]|uniref:efflux RND transporter periplasmic adaptor subunit n=1 Tax=Actinoplanes sp. NBRC 101535 TaxID=3032196 RepID=UPI0024A0AC25|nr:HlyD family efflux transporter periplasmic adaptor subunit [Actinoplanes sp. NBRC 101535]GLY06757.1 hemolysin secretion protein D [Actinoplanes sp. NBRC 101535]
MSKLTGRNRRYRHWRGIGVVIVALGAVAGGITWALADEETAAPATVVIAAVDRGEVTLDVATTGTVQPATTRNLTFAVSGTVDAVDVRPGNTVDKGDTLAAIEDTDAVTAVSDAEEKLADARDRLTQARLSAAKTTKNADSCVRVTARPAISAAPTPCVTQGYPDTGADQVLTAEQAVNNAERAVDRAEDALDGTVITAPIAGTVLAVAGGVGDQAEAGTTFVSLAGTATMQVEADFPEADAGALTSGQTATVTLADAAGLTATVVQVDPVGTSDGTLVRYGVVLAFTDAPADLLIGQSAQVRVRTGQADDVLRVPSTAVHDISDGAGTVLLRSGTTSEERSVTVGLRGDQYTEITGGLDEGAQVVRSW